MQRKTIARTKSIENWRFVLCVSFVALSVASCAGQGAPAIEDLDAVTIRTPHPTFTPTQLSQQPVAADPALSLQTPTAIPAAGSAVQLEQSQAQHNLEQSGISGAFAVVNAPLVNVRSGPSVDSEIVETVERGAEFDIVGRNGDSTWWHICCVGAETGWIIDEYVDTEGPVDAVPVTGGVSAQVRVVESEPAATNSPGEFGFTLATQEQFPETSLVRIYLYVLDGKTALPGYSLQVSKDGVALPVDTKSFGGQPAFTWPFQDARQRYQNLKLEFPDVQAVGSWEVQLINPNGLHDGPPAIFTLASDSDDRELYVRYERK